MPEWALIKDDIEVDVFRGVNSDVVREDVQLHAVDLGMAAKLKHGFALCEGVEIVKYSD